MHCKWVVVTVLDRRRKRSRLLYCKSNSRSPKCSDMCQIRKKRDEGRQKTEMSLGERLTDGWGFTQAEQQASKLISTAACQVDARTP